MMALSGWAVLALVVLALVVIGRWLYGRSLYSHPWYLLLGPADDDRAALVAGARETAVPRPLRRMLGAHPGISWHYLGSGAVINVAAPLAFPGGRHDAASWERVLRLLRRYRPRRPVDGIILAIPAPALLADDWLEQAHDLGTAIRDRLVQTQRYFGFALPVYVVVTGCERVRGFAALTKALPPTLRDTMIGWSNPRTADQPYAPAWLNEGFASLQRGLVRTQVELLAQPARVGDPSDLLLLSRDANRLMAPLRAFLDEVFRPGLYEDLFFLRGFYLTGDGPGPVVAEGTADELTAVPSDLPSAVFTADLIEQKVLPEQGLARPLPAASRARRKRVLIAQVAVAVLAVVLAAGTIWSYVRLQRLRAAYADVLVRGGQLLERRRDLRADASLTAAPGVPIEDRLAQSRDFLQRLQALDARRLDTFFMPLSMVRSLDDQVNRRIPTVIGDGVYRDIRDALTGRAAGWLETAAPDDEDDPQSAGPALKDDHRYQALERFAADYAGLVEQVRRYDGLARGAGSSDLSDASALLDYLGASALPQTGLAPSTRERLRAARGPAIECRTFEIPGGGSLVGARAAALLEAFGRRSFGDENPVVVASSAFAGDWDAVLGGAADTTTLLDLMGHTRDLATSVRTWSPIGTRSQSLALPVIDQPPFRRLAAEGRLCAALRPDLTTAIAEVVALRDQLSDRLLAFDVDPLGPLVVAGDKGLALGDSVARLNNDFDALERETFWAPNTLADTTVNLPPVPAWRADVFDDIVRVADAYELYRGRAFGGLAIADRRELLVPVSTEVANVVSTRLVMTARPGGSPADDPEARLQEIAAIGAQAVKAMRLVPILAMQSPYGSDVLQALDRQATTALEDLDRLAATRYPAIFAGRTGELFAAWDNVQTSTPGPDAVKLWTAQMDELRAGLQYVGGLAGPLVQYLGPRHTTDLTRRWTGVAADIAAYGQKRQDGALARLDTVLHDGVPSLGPAHNCQSLRVDSPAGGGTLFAGLPARIVEEGLRRCWSQVEGRYAAIAGTFNRLLAGRVPFSRALADSADATVTQVTEFLRVYEGQNGRGVRQVLEARSCPADATGFMQGIDAAATLLAPLRTSVPPALSVDFTPEFRVAEGREIGGDQIAQWQMSAGAASAVEGVAGKPIPWNLGDPVTVTLRFARDSPHRPDAAVPGAAVEDRMVRFAYTGRWALLRLLRAGQPSAADRLRLADLGPTVLGFEVPVVRDSSTPPLAGADPGTAFKVFMRLRLSAPGKGDPLPSVEWPVQAPAQLLCAGPR